MENSSGPPLPPEGAGAPPLPPLNDISPPLPSSEHPPIPSTSNANTTDQGQPPLPPMSSEEQPEIEEEEEDPLVVAQREAEEREQALEDAADIKTTDDPALRAFYGEMKDVDRENEVNRILGAFKLNPYEQLGLRFTATDEEIRKQYRKVSLMVHPDKCPHPRSSDAFEMVANAQKELLDEDRRKNIDFVLEHVREELRKEFKKATKHDNAARVAALLNESGKDGVLAAYEETPEFHESWKLKARDVLARAEWRKRKMTKRIAEEEVRAKEEHKQEKEAAKANKEKEKAWEKTRDSRVGNWRDFVGKKSKKTKGGSAAVGGLKPPKLKTSDGDRTYVQRPVGEQFRPPGPKR